MFACVQAHQHTHTYIPSEACTCLARMKTNKKEDAVQFLLYPNAPHLVTDPDRHQWMPSSSCLTLRTWMHWWDRHSPADCFCGPVLQDDHGHRYPFQMDAQHWPPFLIYLQFLEFRNHFLLSTPLVFQASFSISFSTYIIEEKNSDQESSSSYLSSLTCVYLLLTLNFFSFQWMDGPSSI